MEEIKNLNSQSSFYLLLFIAMYFWCCKKEKQSRNIVLSDASIPNIQANILKAFGNLNMKRADFAQLANMTLVVSIMFGSFTSNNEIKQTFKGQLKTYTVINWIKDSAAYLTNQPTTVMNFNDKLGYPYNYIVDGI